MNAIVLGAGIGGPVAAMALARVGITASVVEAHPRSDDDVGSFLSLSSNGLNALAAIDADRPVRELGFPTRTIRMWNHRGRELGSVPMGSALPGAPVARTLRRSELHRGLRDEAERRGISFEYGRRVVALAQTPGAATVRFEDGTELSADLLIGADGVRSLVRTAIDPRAPAARYVGLCNFGGYTPRCGLTDEEPGRWNMIFGRRAFFAHAIDPDGGAVWFANVPRPETTAEERATTSTSQWADQLCSLFEGDAGPATALIRSGALELAGDNTCDLSRVPRWSNGRMVILGDAAHAPSPSSGQGAALAIEDGVALALCLRDAPDIASAFAAFERIRRARVEEIVAQGARSSSSKAAGPVGRVVRDLMLPFVFRHVMTARSQSWIHDHRIEWEPGVIPSAR